MYCILQRLMNIFVLYCRVLLIIFVLYITAFIVTYTDRTTEHMVRSTGEISRETTLDR